MVKRYEAYRDEQSWQHLMDESTSGPFVKYADYDALLKDHERTAEVCRDITARAEKLAAEVAAAKNVVETDIQMLDAARANNEQLAAEVRQWRICVYQDENKPFDERFAAETDQPPDQWVQDGKVFEEDAERCSNMAHKRYNLHGCTECSAPETKDG